MFAVVRTGGKQYRVAANDRITVEKLDGEAGSKITLGDVLLVSDGGALKDAGKVKVTAEIVAHNRGDKVVIFKKKRRHNYRRKNGHRQQLTLLRILAVGDAKAPAKKKAEEPAKGAAPNVDENLQAAEPVKKAATTKKTTAKQAD